jgi:hypothetical protein
MVFTPKDENLFIGVQRLQTLESPKSEDFGLRWVFSYLNTKGHNEEQ